MSTARPANAAQREALRNRIADYLVEMETLFDERCKLSFVMRAPHLEDGDLIVSSDEIGLVIAALERLKQQPAEGGPVR